MQMTLRLVVLAGVLGSASAQFCCAAVPTCPAGFQQSQEPCAATESNAQCETVSLCCKTTYCRPAAQTCNKYTQEQKCTGRHHCYDVDKCNCGFYPQAMCTHDPCRDATCGAGYQCKASYCGGCKYHCVASSNPTPVPAVCNKYTQDQKCTASGHCYHVDKCNCGFYPQAMCTHDPCRDATCGAGYQCKASYCGGCKYHCVASSNPTPVPAVCNKYTQEQKCTASGHCYHVDKCNCGFYPQAMCTHDPCRDATCGAGYQCKASYCGGCKYHCVASSNPTPVPAVCNKYTQEQKCTASGHCYHVDKCNCGSYPQPMCTHDPCRDATCGAGYQCKASYCGGCKYHCVASSNPTPVPAVCNKYTQEQKCTGSGHCYHVDKCNCGSYPQAMCTHDPCRDATCGAGYQCKASYCGGCKYHCVASSNPTPVPAVCNKYTQEQKCTGSGHCYHVDKCNCGFYPQAMCTHDPCRDATCRAGYQCKASYCGGCKSHCVALF